MCHSFMIKRATQNGSKMPLYVCIYIFILIRKILFTQNFDIHRNHKNNKILLKYFFSCLSIVTIHLKSDKLQKMCSSFPLCYPLSTYCGAKMKRIWSLFKLQYRNSFKVRSSYNFTIYIFYSITNYYFVLIVNSNF